MKIQIDTREPTELFINLEKLITENVDTSISKHTNPSVVLVKQNLNVGDIAIYKNNTDIPDIIFERKSINDLLASIKDGRYNEQAFRLNNFPQHNHNIFYIIEGSLEKVSVAQRQTIYSCLFTISHYKGFSIINSANLKHTCEIIYRFSDKFLRENKKNPFYKLVKEEKIQDKKSDDKSILENIVIDERLIKKQKKEKAQSEKDQKETDEAYSSVVKSSKKSNITQNNILEIMLMQIPGVSAKVAQILSQKFKTMKNLIKSLDEDKNCLNDILLNSNRKINKPTINNIFTYILCDAAINVDI